jgi:hypothetical protein
LRRFAKGLPDPILALLFGELISLSQAGNNPGRSARPASKNVQGLHVGLHGSAAFISPGAHYRDMWKVLRFPHNPVACNTHTQTHTTTTAFKIDLMLPAIGM